MKNKGFIASTLLYTFFIIFCAVLITFIGINVHNNNLLKHVEKETQADLQKKTLGDIKYGSYVKFNPRNSNLKTDNIKWIYFNKPGSDRIELVSDSIVIKKGSSLNIDTALSLVDDDCFISSPRVLNYNDFYVSIYNNVQSSINKYNIAKSIESYIIYFLQNGKYYKYNFNQNYSISDIEDIYDPTKNLTEISNINTSELNIRIVITLGTKMEVTGGRGTYYNPYTISNNLCESSTLLAKLYEDNNITNNISSSSPNASPGTTISGSNEKILANAADDYGTLSTYPSLYFRGAVENNYVVFANMCWRIVRITGGNKNNVNNNAIKLVLYNYNPNNVTNPCATSQDGTDRAFIRTLDTAYKTVFNNTANKNTYVGYMYSNNLTSDNYDVVYRNDKDSNALSLLKNWYEEKLINYNDKIADVIWCNDKREVSNKDYDPWSVKSSLTNSGAYFTYFMPTYRLVPTSSAAPSLICSASSGDTSTNKLSRYTSDDSVNGNAKLNGYKIGLLTADEIAFAGGAYNIQNTSYYLYKNASAIRWFTLSPLNFAAGSASPWVVTVNGSLNAADVNNEGALRPSIALKNNVKIQSGNGTSADPYVIKR